MRWTAIALVLALALGVCAGGVALAASAVVEDERGDVTTSLDVVRSSMRTGKRLQASVRMASPWAADALRAADGDSPGSVCITIWTRRKPGGQPPDYLVCANAATEGDAYSGSVLRERNGLPRRVASASIRRSSDRTIVLRFAQSAIGKPRRLRFAVQATPAGCSAGPGCTDNSPERGRTKLLRIR